MVRKRNKEKEFINKSQKVLRLLCIGIALILTVIYCANGGLYSLLFDLRESKTVIIYSIIIIVLLVMLIICNISDNPEGQTEKQKDISSYITVGIIVLTILFAILLIFTLIDFFLPIIVLSIILVVAYFLTSRLIKYLVNKHGIK